MGWPRGRTYKVLGEECPPPLTAAIPFPMAASPVTETHLPSCTGNMALWSSTWAQFPVAELGHKVGPWASDQAPTVQ